MAEDLKISELPETVSATKTDPLPVVNGGVTSRITKANYLNLDTDGTLAGNSDTRIPSQKAIKTYSDTKIASTYLDTDVTLAANSDSKIATQKATKTYANTKYPVFNVVSYGATGDGSTDDSTAIQSCITAVSTAGGGVIVFPKGVYKVGTTITMPNNCLVLGLGGLSNGSNDGGVYNGAVEIIAKSTLSGDLIDISDKISITFQDIRFDGDKDYTSFTGSLIKGIYTSAGNKNITFERCSFQNSPNSGNYAIRTQTSTGTMSGITFKDCRFTNNQQGVYNALGKVVWTKFINCVISDNVRSDNAGVLRFINSNCLVDNCDMEGNTGTFIKAVGGADVASVISIHDNDLEAYGAYNLIDIDSFSGGIVHDNEGVTMGGSAIRMVACNNYNVHDNNFTGTTNNGYGCYVVGNSDRFNVQDNTFYGDFFSGITLETGYTMNNYIVTGNNTTDGVVDNGGGSTKSVAHNL